MHITLHLILISLISGGVFANAIPPICCFPKQFESLMFATNTGVENGRGFVGLDFAFTNGTIRTAYDLVNMRTYMLSKYLMEEEDPQENMEWNVTIVQDYKNVSKPKIRDKVRIFISKTLISLSTRLFTEYYQGLLGICQI